MESLKVALEGAVSLVTALSPENAISFLAWWKGEQCQTMLPIAARPDVTLLQIPPAMLKLRYSRRDAILRMAYFPEVQEMVACEIDTD